MSISREELEGLEAAGQLNSRPALRKKLEAISRLKAFGAALGSSAVVLGLRNMVTELEAQASALDDSATQLGLHSQELQLYRYAAKMAGVETQAFDQALQILNVNQGAAAEGSKAQAEAFKAVGVEAKGAALAEMSLSELLPQIADGLSKVTSTSERARLAKQLLGKQGAKLAPLLGQGATGIEKFRKEIELLGGGLSGDGVGALTEYGDQMDRLDMATTSLKLAIAKGLVPIFTSFMEKLAFGIGRTLAFADSIGQAVKNSGILKASMLMLATRPHMRQRSRGSFGRRGWSASTRSRRRARQSRSASAVQRPSSTTSASRPGRPPQWLSAPPRQPARPSRSPARQRAPPSCT